MASKVTYILPFHCYDWKCACWSEPHNQKHTHSIATLHFCGLLQSQQQWRKHHLLSSHDRKPPHSKLTTGHWNGMPFNTRSRPLQMNSRTGIWDPHASNPQHCNRHKEQEALCLCWTCNYSMSYHFAVQKVQRKVNYTVNICRAGTFEELYLIKSRRHFHRDNKRTLEVFLEVSPTQT